MGYKRCDLSVTMTGDDALHELNRLWRSKDKPTDVLSFSQMEGPAVPGQPATLGDVIVSYDTAAQQAQVFGHSFDYEIQRLLVHGVLHCLGHDHVHGGHQARIMRLEEERLLKLLRRRPLR